jgi:hypothetical protein
LTINVGDEVRLLDRDSGAVIGTILVDWTRGDRAHLGFKFGREIVIARPGWEPRRQAPAPEPAATD